MIGPAEKLQALIDARAGEADMASLRVQVGRIMEVVRTFIPRERWAEVQAALRGDPTLRRQQQSAPAQGVRMVAIGDPPMRKATDGHGLPLKVFCFSHRMCIRATRPRRAAIRRARP